MTCAGSYKRLVSCCDLRIEWLWQEPLPHPLRVLGEIANVEPDAVERFLRALA